jgi:Tfp pilus assembly protein PilO
MPLTGTQRVNAVGLAALAGVGAAAYLVGLGPMMEAKEFRVALTERVRETNKEAIELHTRVAEQERKAAELAAQLRRARVQLRPAGQINTRLSELNQLVTEAGLRIESQQQGPPAYQGRYGTVSIQLQARGTFAQCTVFLRRVAELCADVGVESLEMSGNAEDAAGEGSLSAGLIWYIAPPDIPAGKPARPA